MKNKKNNEIDYELMTAKISEWKNDIENHKPLMVALKKLADE